MQPIEVGIERQHMGTITDGLNQLRSTDFSRRQEDNGWDASIGGIGSESGTGVAGTGTGNGFDGTTLGHHLFDDTDQIRSYPSL